MLNKLNLNNIFFLSDSVKVNSLDEGARQYGGATMFEDGVCVSGVAKSDELIVNNKTYSVISIFIPSTLNVNKEIDNSKFVERYLEMFNKIFKNDGVISHASGSWVDANNNIVIEKQTIISSLENLTKTKYEKLLRLAKRVKREMLQEGVTITIDNAFLIV